MEKITIKKIICLLVLSCLTACCSYPEYKLMNHQYFQKIPNGCDFQFVTAHFGPPFDVKLLKNCIKEYRYIQRNAVAPGVMEYVYFIITVSRNGRVINKTTDTVTGTSELYVQ